MAAEFIDTIAILKLLIPTIAGSSVVTLLISKFLGRKKEEIEYALDMQKFYNKHIEDIKEIHEDEIESIKKLHAEQLEEVKKAFKEEIEILINKVDEAIQSKEECERNRRLWEEDSMRKDDLLKEKDKKISELIEENEGNN